MNARFVFCVCAITACGYLSYQSAFALLEVPVLNHDDKVSDSGVNLNVNDSSPDMIATKMKFNQKKFDEQSYDLMDYAFVVGNNSRICPQAICKFEFDKINLGPTANTPQLVLSGRMKVDTGDVKKIFNIYSLFQSLEEREENGQTIETVEGTFRIGKEPVNNAEYTYNINGTLVTNGKDKTLSLQGVQCTAVNITDFTIPSNCNY